jgi:hypothetical protein
MIPSLIKDLKRLPDDQLARVIKSARAGDMTAIEALNLTSATPVLAEMMRRDRIREMWQKNMMGGAPDPQTVLDQQLAKADATQGVGGLEIPGVMEERAYAGGGIVAFNSGGSAAQQSDNILYSPEYYGGEEPPAAPGFKEPSPEEIARMTPNQRRNYLDERTRRRYAENRAALGSAPTEMTPEERREEYQNNIELAQSVSGPYLKRMQELLAQSKPDEAKIGQDAAKRAINMGLLSLIGAKRMPGESRMSSFASNIGEALRTGAGAYEKGVGGIDKLKREYVSSELKFVEAQNAAARGDMKAAQDLAQQAANDRKTAASIYRTSIRGLDAREKEELDNNLNQTVAEIRAAGQERATEAKEREAQLRYDAMIRRAGIMAGGGGGARPMTDGQFVAAVTRAESAIRGDSRLMTELRKQYGRGEALDDAIYKMATDKVNKLMSDRPGRTAPKPGEKPSGKPSATLPEGAVSIPLLP